MKHTMQIVSKKLISLCTLHMSLQLMLFCGFVCFVFFCIFFIASLVDLHLTGNVILIAGIFLLSFFLKIKK